MVGRMHKLSTRTVPKHGHTAIVQLRWRRQTEKIINLEFLKYLEQNNLIGDRQNLYEVATNGRFTNIRYTYMDLCQNVASRESRIPRFNCTFVTKAKVSRLWNSLPRCVFPTRPNLQIFNSIIKSYSIYVYTCSDLICKIKILKCSSDVTKPFSC